MTLEILQQMQANLEQDLLAFLPELILCGTIVLMLLLRMFSGLDRLHSGYVALAASLIALFVSWQQWRGVAFDPRPEETVRLDLFTGLLIYDNLSIFLKIFLLAFTSLTIWLTLITKIPDREDSPDFYTLLLGATLGMMLMASAQHLLMIFIAIEMASLPSYAMAGFLKGKRKSSEAALKYVVYGSGAAGVMLYGMSLLAGKFGTGYLPDVAAGLIAMMEVSTALDPTLLLGVLFILIGFAFKIAAVPFHFWCPDVFEGATAEVAGFLSVASKGAALALLARFSLALVGMAGLDPQMVTWDGMQMSSAFKMWTLMVPYLVPALGMFAILTSTFGNLAAFTQNNLKRLLAYSTIAHAGYMMMAIATMTTQGMAAVLFYLVVYLFMNLGAFACVAFLRNLTGSEDLADFRGVVNRAPTIVICLGICLMSLLGIPPLAGFAGKFQIFRVLYDAGTYYALPAIAMPGISTLMYVMMFALGINSVISLFYYVKVLKVMILEKPLEEVEGRTPEPYKVPISSGIYSCVMAVFMFVLGIFWSTVIANSETGVDQFKNPPLPKGQAVAQEDRS